MSRYEADPAGLGVGKRYGALATGSTSGVTVALNGVGKWVVEVGAEELAVAQASGYPLEFSVPEGVALVSEVFVEVVEAFGVGDTVDVFKDDGSAATVLGAPIAVDATGLVEGTVADRTLAAGDRLYVNADAIDSGSTAGFIKVVVEFQRV